MVYVANGNINVYDKDLIYNYILPVPYTTWFITGYNGQMVVTDNNNGNIYFYQGNIITQTIQTQCSGRITTVLFDDYNQMLVLCYFSYLYLYLIFFYDIICFFTWKQVQVIYYEFF